MRLRRNVDGETEGDRSTKPLTSIREEGRILRERGRDRSVTLEGTKAGRLPFFMMLS